MMLWEIDLEGLQHLLTKSVLPTSMGEPGAGQLDAHRDKFAILK